MKFAKENDIIISYDPNYRALLWENTECAVNGMRLPLSFVDIIKISEEETELLTDEKNPDRAIDRLIDSGIKCVIVTLGKDGALIGTKNDRVKIDAAPCKRVVDTTGAGDSFMGAFLYKMSNANLRPDELTKAHLAEFGEFAGKVAAYCIGKRGAIDAMPKLSEI